MQSDFTNGGDVSEVDVYKWQGGATRQGVRQRRVRGRQARDARTRAPKRTPGPSPPRGPGDITAPYFFEGGLNLTALFPGQSLPCFSTFITNTRSSHSESATLKDFALGSIDTCASIKITKQATPSDGTQFGYSTTGGLNPASFSLLAGSSQTLLEAAARRLLGERERSCGRLGVRQPLLPDGLGPGHERPGDRLDREHHARVPRRTSSAPTSTSASRR